MFSLLHGCLEYALRKEELHILILGLDKAGKTTLLEKIKELHGLPGLEWDKILPTVGLNVGRIEWHNCLLIFWDLGGQVRAPPVRPSAHFCEPNNSRARASLCRSDSGVSGTSIMTRSAPIRSATEPQSPARLSHLLLVAL